MASQQSLPSNGFIGLLTRADPFAYHLKRIAMQSTALNGLFPNFDDRRIEAAYEIWRDAIFEWYKVLRGRKHEDVSHIKMAGALLWSFIQEESCPIDDVVPIRTARHHRELEMYGASGSIREFSKERGKVMRASPNPSIGYIFTTMIFNSIQRARGMTRSGIDFDDPPMTKHYFHNLCCWYMVEQSPSKEDLYMIYKTMDLYALDQPPEEKLALRR